jgi:hypothetical protein
MKGNLLTYIVLFATAAMASSVLATGCKKPYAPKLVSSPTKYLVVEGIINSGDSTIFKLSRTVNLTSSLDSVAELNAQVTVEGNDGNNYPIPEVGHGEYAAPALGLDTTKQYRVMIKTADGKQYRSDFTASKSTPPIDSIGFSIQSKGLQLYVNTHDPKNSTRYYRWDYQETWQFHAKYESTYISNDTTIIPRTAAQQVYYCFHSDVSSSITLGSSARLQQDIIYQQPLTQIPSTSEKIETRYSILVKQYALTSDAFNYWQNLKKNTEQLGSIFDAQPSELTGNIHCITNPAEPVIGYISVGNVQQKRVFIDNTQLPHSWIPDYPYTCPFDTLLYCRGMSCINQVAQDLIPLPPAEQPLSPYYNAGVIAGYYATYKDCMDCTIRGTQVVPTFWKNE